MKKFTLSTVMNYDKSNGFAKILTLDNRYDSVSFDGVNAWDAIIDVYQQGRHIGNFTPRHFKYAISWVSLHILKITQLSEDYSNEAVDTVLAQVPTENGVDLYVSSLLDGNSWVKTRVEVVTFSNQGKWIEGSEFIDISSMHPVYCKSNIANNSAGYHNSIYRGKDLTSKYSVQELEGKLGAGNFSDLFIGDYITVSTTIKGVTEDVDYVIAGFDYFLGCGNSEQILTSHHAVMIPRNTFRFDIRMNDSNTTANGYYGSKAHGTTTISSSNAGLTNLKVEYDTFKSSSLNSTGTYVFTYNGSVWTYSTSTYTADQLKNTFGISYTGTPSNADTLTVNLVEGNLEPYRNGIYNAFNRAHCLTYKDFLTTSTSAGEWHTARVELMNECMVYGSKMYANTSEGEKTKMNQLPLFALRPDMKVVTASGSENRGSYWLSSINSSSDFCEFGSWANADHHGANNTHGVRPFFLLG